MIHGSFSHLRGLEDRDAPLMLEWMHEEALVKDLYSDFLHKSLEDCRQFIRASQTPSESLHLAAVDESGTYMGTVSLKELSPTDRSAEFGICMRSAAQGSGLAAAAMKELLAYGYRDLGLESVYWCVSPGNARANHFYQKNGYKTVEQPPGRLQRRYAGFGAGKLIWYRADRADAGAALPPAGQPPAL